MRAGTGASPAADNGDLRGDTAPLTVAGVARTLGVAASTLRTWDRRYGLGPSTHQAGSHRRYSPDDVARLRTMRRLTLRGVAPADAARIATSAEVGEGGEPNEAETPPAGGDDAVVVDPLTLAAAVIEPDPWRVSRILQRAAAGSGLIGAWSELVLPAFEMLHQRRRAAAERPGADPEGVLEAAVMALVRDIAANGEPDNGHAEVRVLTGREDRLTAHVVSGGLAERGVPALVTRAEHVDAAEGRLAWLGEARVLVVVQSPPLVEEIVTAASERADIEVFLLGAGAPRLWLPHVHRVRTVPAAVVEAVAATRA